MGKFRGHSQDAGRTAPRHKISQKQTVALLRPLIDASMAKAATPHRDKAREAVHAVLANSRWNSAYVLKNIGARRCRYLARIGYPVPTRFSMASRIEALQQWQERQG